MRLSEPCASFSPRQINVKPGPHCRNGDDFGDSPFSAFQFWRRSLGLGCRMCRQCGRGCRRFRRKGWWWWWWLFVAYFGDSSLQCGRGWRLYERQRQCAVYTSWLATTHAVASFVCCFPVPLPHQWPRYTSFQQCCTVIFFATYLCFLDKAKMGQNGTMLHPRKLPYHTELYDTLTLNNEWTIRLSDYRVAIGLGIRTGLGTGTRTENKFLLHLTAGRSSSNYPTVQ